MDVGLDSRAVKTPPRPSPPAAQTPHPRRPQRRGPARARNLPPPGTRRPPHTAACRRTPPHYHYGSAPFSTGSAGVQQAPPGARAAIFRTGHTHPAQEAQPEGGRGQGGRRRPKQKLGIFANTPPVHKKEPCYSRLSVDVNLALREK